MGAELAPERSPDLESARPPGWPGPVDLCAASGSQTLRVTWDCIRVVTRGGRSFGLNPPSVQFRGEWRPRARFAGPAVTAWVREKAGADTAGRCPPWSRCFSVFPGRRRGFGSADRAFGPERCSGRRRGRCLTSAGKGITAVWPRCSSDWHFHSVFFVRVVSL